MVGACGKWLVALLLGLSSAGLPAAEKSLVFSTFEQSGARLVQEPVLREAYRRLGYDIEILTYPGRRAVDMANRGQVDGELARLDVIKTLYPDLRQVPVPVHQLSLMAFTRDTRFQVEGWQSLQPYTVITLSGYKYTELKLDQWRVPHTLASRFDLVLSAVASGKVEVGLLNRYDGLQVMQRLALKELTLLPQPVEQFPTYHYLHKKHRALVPRVAAQLAKLHQEGFIARQERLAVEQLTRDR